MLSAHVSHFWSGNVEERAATHAFPPAPPPALNGALQLKMMHAVWRMYKQPFEMHKQQAMIQKNKKKPLHRPQQRRSWQSALRRSV